jgi:pimeloyl-ACP methyl ester carboxylesterase
VKSVAVIDRLVSHVSALPSLKGVQTQLFVREKFLEGVKPGKAVLLIGGGIWPSTVTFDLAYKDYSWMDALARAGLHVFAMDLTGYGRSSRPFMDDPANLSAKSQQTLIPLTLKAETPAPHPYRLATIDSEVAEIDRMVDHIRALRGVTKVSLLGWTGGGTRAGVYASRYPEKVDRLIIVSSSGYKKDGSSDAPSLPEPGNPVRFETRHHWESRWPIAKPDQVEQGISDIVWQASMAADPIGALWGPGGVRSPSRTQWGWNPSAAAKVTHPTLVMSGALDALLPRNLDMFGDLGTAKKVFIEIDEGSHFMSWERQRRVLHAASKDWLTTGKIAGATSGTFRADAKGKIARRKSASAWPAGSARQSGPRGCRPATYRNGRPGRDRKYRSSGRRR